MAIVKRETRRGKVLGLLSANGRWLAVVQGFSHVRGGVVVAMLCDPASLKGSHRRKASRWLVEL